MQKGEGALSLYQLKVKEKENRGLEDRIFVFSCISQSVSKISEQGETETCEEVAILKYLKGKHKQPYVITFWLKMKCVFDCFYNFI